MEELVSQQEADSSPIEGDWGIFSWAICREFGLSLLDLQNCNTTQILSMALTINKIHGKGKVPNKNDFMRFAHGGT